MHIGKINHWERKYMTVEQIVEIVETQYAEKYYNFQEFKMDEQYKAMWDMCMNTVKNRDLIINIIFCNDVYQIPPVRVFIDINREQIENLIANDKTQVFFENGRMKTYIKQSIGAFWGMVFRFALGYEDRRTVSVVKEKNYGVQTASRFIMYSNKEKMYLMIE